MADQTLEEDARYGKFSFDVFALEKWDYTAPVAEDEQQWKKFALEYLELTPAERQPYHAHTFGQSDRPVLDPDKVSRVLVPHQTFQERNITTWYNTPRPVKPPIWLRTCYLPELEETHAKLLGDYVEEPNQAVDWKGVLNNSELYNFGTNWSRIVLRIPELSDGVRGGDVEDWHGSEAEGKEDAVERADCRAVVHLLVADEEALREETLKVVWLDVHGACVWWNRIKTESLEAFSEQYYVGRTLGEMVLFAKDGDKSEQKGAELVF